MTRTGNSLTGALYFVLLSLAISEAFGAPPPPAMPFACRHASGTGNDPICADEELSRLRAALTVQWGTVIAIAHARYVHFLVEDQRRWAGFVARRCAGAMRSDNRTGASALECLRPFFYQRLKYFAKDESSGRALALLLPEVSRVAKSLRNSMSEPQSIRHVAHDWLENYHRVSSSDIDEPSPEELERLASRALSAGVSVEVSWALLGTAIEDQRLAARYGESAGAYFLAYKTLAERAVKSSLKADQSQTDDCAGAASTLKRMLCLWRHWLHRGESSSDYLALDELIKSFSQAAAQSMASSTAEAMVSAQHNLSRVLVKSGQSVAAAMVLKMPPLNHSEGEAQQVLAMLLSKYALRTLAVDGELHQGRPQICLTLSADLRDSNTLDYSQYVSVDPPIDQVVSIDGTRLCVSGVRAGKRYEVTLRRGLSGRTGVALPVDFKANVAVPDLSPSIRFPGNGYVMPRFGSRGVPIATVNASSVALQILRISDRNIIHQKHRGTLLEDLSPWQLKRLLDEEAQVIWEGDLEVELTRNETVITAVPLNDVIPEQLPGFYLLVAEGSIFQWVIISDLGLITYLGEDGLTVLTRSLQSGRSVAGVEVVLYGRNNHVLAREISDERGLVTFAPGWVRGQGGHRVDSLMAFDAKGDFAYLSLTRPAFDLSDRGVGGRALSGHVDGMLYTERGLYRPGETVHLTGIVRTRGANSLPNLPLTVLIVRPDGVTAQHREVVTDAAGMFGIRIQTTPTDRTGRWQIIAQLAEGAAPIAQVHYQLNDFVPPRIELELEPDANSLVAQQRLGLRLRANFLYGPPGVDLSIEAQATLEYDREPFAGFEDYVFGLKQESFTPVSQDLKIPNTDSQGHSHLEYRLGRLPQTTLPLKLTLRTSVFEKSGRSVNQMLALPIRREGVLLGLKPLFQNGRVGANQTASFNIVALDEKGRLVESDSSSWVLYEEVREYFWYQTEDDQWQWRYATQDRVISSGTVATSVESPTNLEVKPDGWGYFRLEVIDKATTAASSIRFEAGWTSSPVAEKSPDRMLVRLDKENYAVGQVAWIRLEAPFAGEVILSVLGNKVHLLRQFSIPKSGITVPLEVSEDWGTGVYVSATALRPGSAVADKGPSRALGLSWLAVNSDERKLKVSMTVPQRIKPNQTIEIPVRVDGLQSGPAQLTLAAVDDAVLQLTDFQAPVPEQHFFAKRRLGIDIRDIYGRLIRAAVGRRGELRSGAGVVTRADGSHKRPSKVIALFSGLVNLDAKGRASVEITVPEFNGRLRLMAVAVGPRGVGSAQAMLTVRESVVAALDLPRFMAPGDIAQIGMSFALTDGPPGLYHYALKIEGPLAVQNETLAAGTLRLKSGERSRRTLSILATDTGDAVLALTVDGPGDADTIRHYDLTLRAPATRIVERSLVTLKPGESLPLSAKLLSGFNLKSTTLRFSASNTMGLDTTSLLTELSHYPYGCLEQTTSRAMSFLHYHDVSEAAHLAHPIDSAQIRQIVESAAARIASLQRNDGSFGLWHAFSPREPWLSVYALHFLTRAQESGFAVNRQTLRRGLSWLSGYVSAARADKAFSIIAPYGAYVLAGVGRLVLSDLRYLDEVLSRGPFLSALARSQLGAALSMLGDFKRAEVVLAPTVSDLAQPEDDSANYYSYGSPLRDLAARLSFVLEAGDPLEQSGALLRKVGTLWTNASSLSTQTQAWLVLATRAAQKGSPPQIAVGGLPVVGQGAKVNYQFDSTDLEHSSSIVNLGNKDTYIALTRAGTVITPQPPLSAGFIIDRVFLDFDGAEVDLDNVRQNDLLVGVITGEAQTNLRQPSRTLVVDLLPAGFELENEAFNNGRSIKALDWLTDELLSDTDFQALRDDRYVGAMTLANGERFRLAYVVRAVTPGHYVLPNVHIEDMYVPSLNARGGTGKLRVVSVP